MNMFKARVLFIESRCQQASVTSSAPIVHSARETNISVKDFHFGPFFPPETRYTWSTRWPVPEKFGS